MLIKINYDEDRDLRHKLRSYIVKERKKNGRILKPL